MLQSGLYEQVINKKINESLQTVPTACKAIVPVDEAEAPKVLSQYLADIIEKGLAQVSDNGGSLDEQVKLSNEIIALIQSKTEDADYKELAVEQQAEQLTAIMAENNPDLLLGKTAFDLQRPATSIAQSTILTATEHEPQLYSELKSEFRSANRVDMLVSFIKWSGLRLILDDIKAFLQKGGILRVISTCYMGATDIKAIEELSKLENTTIKISYDTSITRLHAKAYIFYRNTGFSTAYVGSSNLSSPAQTNGLEWNVKVTYSDQPDIMQKMAATFDTYWHTESFEQYSEEDHDRLNEALQHNGSSDNGPVFFYDLHPYSYQQEILDRLTAEREVRRQYRNLVVAATGTGKTMIAAFDYRNFCKAHAGRANKLLFVAHREEILIQSKNAFQAVLKDPNFGDLYVGSSKPISFDHLFASIQTINSQDLCEKFPADYYDFIIVDEFHRAAAPTYQKLLEHFQPQILLGLTATPERMDGKDILDYFNGRVAAEIRLPEAIERRLLCPFQYFGVADTVDLKDLRWTRGGYDKTELSNLYSANRVVANRRADHIVRTLNHYVTNVSKMKCIAFCVSVQHAEFMADYFNRSGIPAIALSGQSSDEERHNVRKRLDHGELKIIATVDLFNEGVDIPQIDTVMFLRPTESLTIFLQQLGRGLRLADGKECLTVLDYIGAANTKYNFEEKFSALLTNTRHSVQYEIQHEFISSPKGCYIQLEKKAASAILENIRHSFNDRSGLLGRIETFKEDTGKDLTLANFLEYYHLDARYIYKRDSFSRLCASAQVIDDFDEPIGTSINKSLYRLASVDSRRWINFLQRYLPRIEETDCDKLLPIEQLFLQMFYITVWGKAAFDWYDAEVRKNLLDLAHSPTILHEMLDLLQYNLDHIDFIDEPVNVGFLSPLDLHCTYTRDQLLVALDYLTPSNVREGVKWLPEKKVDILFVTLNKADKDYSPSTMYKDYSVNENLFHWQSQSTTAENSETGQRYINHKARGSKVLLFVREYKNDSFGSAAAYTFLGTCNYVSHEGSKPMSITWDLDRPIPAKYLKQTSKLMVE